MLKKTLLAIFIFSSAIVSAQNASSSKISLDENSVIRGEDGLVYPYATCRKMVSTGKYAIKKRGTFSDSGKPEFLIFKLSAEESSKYLNQIPKPRISESFKEGDNFNGFKTTDINGNKFDLREATGKIIVLNFWFINCPPCKQEIPQLNELMAEYKDNSDVLFLAIALDDKYALKDFLKNTAFNYNVVDGRPIATKYGVKRYPTHVVIDKENKIKFSTVGLASNTIHWIKKSINESLAGN